MNFSSTTIAERTPIGQRQSVESESMGSDLSFLVALL